MLAVFVEIQFKFKLAVVAPGVRPSISGLKVPFEGVAAKEDEDALDDEDSRDDEDEDALDDEDTPVAEDKGTPDEDDIFSLGLEMSAELLLGSSPLEEDGLLSILALEDDPSKSFKSIISGALEQAKNKAVATTHKNARTLLLTDILIRYTPLKTIL